MVEPETSGDRKGVIRDIWFSAIGVLTFGIFFFMVVTLVAGHWADEPVTQWLLAIPSFIGAAVIMWWLRRKSEAR